ncbi:MAG TPA: hypothetical protein VI408_10675, partial [Gaiellaceae bacterium]
HTDVYSLGIVLYELLTGEVPFKGENFVAVAMRHINEPPPPIRDKRPDVPPRVEAAVQRAMAKDPEARFQTMSDFCRELEACLAEVQQSAGTQVAAAPLPVRRRRSGISPWPLVLLLVALIAIGAVVAALLLRSHHAAKRNSGGGSTPGSGSIHLRAVTAYDPYGTGAPGENNAAAGRATDASPSTYWETERYYNHPSLNKKGVGLVLDAGKAVTLHHLGLSTGTPGFTAEILAGDSETGPFPDVVGQSQTVNGQATYTIAGGAHRYYVIWITRLGGSYDTAQVNFVTAN